MLARLLIKLHFSSKIHENAVTREKILKLDNHFLQIFYVKWKNSIFTGLNIHKTMN